MFDELTPEQAFELCAYAGMEPFGEVRADLRMGHMLRFYYDSKRGKKGRAMTLGEFTLYDDIAESASKKRMQDSLLEQLNSIAVRQNNG